MLQFNRTQAVVRNPDICKAYGEFAIVNSYNLAQIPINSSCDAG